VTDATTRVMSVIERRLCVAGRTRLQLLTLRRFHPHLSRYASVELIYYGGNVPCRQSSQMMFTQHGSGRGGCSIDDSAVPRNTVCERITFLSDPVSTRSSAIAEKPRDALCH